MKKVMSVMIALLMLFCLFGCEKQNTPDDQTSPGTTQNTQAFSETTTGSSTTTETAAELDDEALAKIVAGALGVPDDAEITYEVGEKVFWDAHGGDMKQVEFYRDSQLIAGAFVDPCTGELLRNIMKYDRRTTAERLTEEIESAYAEEAQLPENMSTVGMVELAYKYTDKWAQVAQEYYDRIMRYEDTSEDGVLASELHTSVAKMKADWEVYAQAECENYANTLNAIYRGGTIMQPMLADHKYELQKEWALQLIYIYEML